MGRHTSRKIVSLPLHPDLTDQPVLNDEQQALTPTGDPLRSGEGGIQPCNSSPTGLVTAHAGSVNFFTSIGRGHERILLHGTTDLYRALVYQPLPRRVKMAHEDTGSQHQNQAADGKDPEGRKRATDAGIPLFSRHRRMDFAHIGATVLVIRIGLLVVRHGSDLEKRIVKEYTF